MLVVRDRGTEGGGSPPMTAATADETVDWIEYRDLGRISVVVEEVEGWRARTVGAAVMLVAVAESPGAVDDDGVVDSVSVATLAFATTAVAEGKGEDTSRGEVDSLEENNPCI